MLSDYILPLNALDAAVGNLVMISENIGPCIAE